MSEFWNEESFIEEKESLIKTPQLSDLKVYFSLGNIFEIISYYNRYGLVKDNDYPTLINFLNSEHAIEHPQIRDQVKALFDDRWKEEYFKIKLNDNKEKLQSYSFNLLYNYFINNTINDKEKELLKEVLYKAMVKIPELFQEDMLSQNFKKKIAAVLSNEEIKQRDTDSTQLNQHDNKLADFLYRQKLTNSKLKAEILKDLPPDYSLLEKSIYIYINLCKKLSYDPNYYTNNHLYYPYHEDFKNVTKIGDETNNVVCFEFVTILTEMLQDLGIKVSSSINLLLEMLDNGNITFSGFDNHHAKLEYTVDGIVVFADSTTSILNGDLINAKMNNRLNGLKCLSVNKEAKEKFKNALDKVYSDLSFSDTDFKKYDSDIRIKPLPEKLKILFDNLINSSFNPTDFISYITNLKHKFFNPSELDWNLKITFLGKNNGENQYPIALFSVNANNIKDVPQDTVQYLYDPLEKTIVKLEKEELESMFYNGIIFYIDGKAKIPNIETSTGIKMS